MKVAVLIVNWNSGPLLENCLKHLDRQTRPPDRIVIVDNDSADDSLARVGARWSVHVIKLGYNAGFAAATNAGADAAADCDAFALLNPDAFAEPEWLEALVRAATEHPECASFGSQMRSAADPEMLDGTGDVYHVSGLHWRRSHRTRQTNGNREAGDIFSACAAAALCRADAFRQAGGFDASYGCYSEDVDLGFRLRLLGHECRYVPDAVVRHVGSALSGVGSDFSVYHGHRNLIWTYVKNMPPALFWLYLPQHLCLNVVSLVWFALRGQGGVILRAKHDAVRALPRVWRQRAVVMRQRRVTAGRLRSVMARGLLAPYAARASRQLPQ